MRQIYLLLFTAGVSFALGLFVGRSSAPVQPIIKVTMPADTKPAVSDNYNFYKALPKGETTALGSGINHAPPSPPSPPPSMQETDRKPAAVASAKEEESLSTAAVTETKETAKSSRDTWILQAASLPQESDAQNLGKRLRGKGYKVEIKAVVVKGKTWYRLYVGPYTSSEAVKEAASKLSRQEKLAPIARKI